MIIRTIFPKINQHLSSDKVTLLTGARQVGKTTLMKQCIKHQEEQGVSCVYITLEQEIFKNALNTNPENILQFLPTSQKKVIVCIDEIQYLDNPTNFLKLLYDEHRERIKLFVTGSSSFYIDRKFKDSLAGRKEIFELWTLSFQEFLSYKWKSNLTYNILHKTEISLLFDEYLRFGWYPELVQLPEEEDKKRYLQLLTSTYIQKDIRDANLQHSEKYFQLLQLLAEQTGKLVNMSELWNIVWLSTSTIQDYLYVMQKSYHIWLLRPFSKNIRKEIIRMPKVYFHDAWLRNYCCNNYNPMILRQDKWECLEQYVRQVLQKRYDMFSLHYRRNKSGQEVDFILNRDHQAREIKRDKKTFRLSKYQQFQKDYPDFNLICKDYEDIIQLSL